MMKKLGTLKAKLVEQRVRKAALENCVAFLRAMDRLVTAFYEELFTALVDKVIVGRDGTLRFVLKDESER